jgi:hypothetical protein
MARAAANRLIHMCSFAQSGKPFNDWNQMKAIAARGARFRGPMIAPKGPVYGLTKDGRRRGEA